CFSYHASYSIVSLRAEAIEVYLVLSFLYESLDQSVVLFDRGLRREMSQGFSLLQMGGSFSWFPSNTPPENLEGRSCFPLARLRNLFHEVKGSTSRPGRYTHETTGANSSPCRTGAHTSPAREARALKTVGDRAH